MDPFAQYDPSPLAESVAQFSADPMVFDDDVFNFKPSHALGAGFTPGLSQGDFPSLADFDNPFSVGLTREQRRELNLSSPDGGSNVSSNVTSPEFATSSAFGSVPDLLPSRTDGSAAYLTQPLGSTFILPPVPSSPTPNINGFGLGFPRGIGSYRYTVEGNEYVSDPDDIQADDLDDPMAFIGMAPVARRESHNSQRSWRTISDSSSGGEEDGAGSPFGAGSSPSSQYSPPVGAYFNPHGYAQTLIPTSAMLRSTSIESGASSSAPSPFHCEGVNPSDVNPRSQPVTPEEQTTALDAPFEQRWWNGPTSRSVDALTDGLNLSMGLDVFAGTGMGPVRQEGEEGEATLRAKERMRESLAGVFAIGPSEDLTIPSTPLDMQSRFADSFNVTPGLSTSLPTPSALPRTRGRRGQGADRASPRSSRSTGRSPVAKLPRSLFGISDYSDLPTKRSRGRRPALSKDVGLASPDGTVVRGLQAVSGGAAFDPSLHPMAAAVEFCDTTKTGKPKKIFVCEVIACGKVFKRSEHLKRHVRSIHTDDKPFACPWKTCTKMFNRHDNLNQHLRVHRIAEDGGHVLEGLSVGSDGVLRREEDGERIDPVPLGLKNVELDLSADDDFDFA